MKIHIANASKRNATIIATSPVKKEKLIPAKGGKPVKFQRYVAAGEKRLNEDLVQNLGDNYSSALIESDPEIDFEVVGRKIEETNSVLLDSNDNPLFCAPEILEIIYGPDGKELERRVPVDSAANINTEIPIAWTGRLIPKLDLIRKFAIKRTLQLRHIDGVTYDFLYGIAKELHDKESVMLVGGGSAGKDPLILQLNGSPYRGFLDGRVEGETYLLLLHLSSMELKQPSISKSNEASEQ